MKYDTNEYAALGVGEKIEAGHYAFDTSLGTIAPVGNFMIGELVTDALSDTYLRRIVPATIEKTTFATGAIRTTARGFRRISRGFFLPDWRP